MIYMQVTVDISLIAWKEMKRWPENTSVL